MIDQRISYRYGGDTMGGPNDKSTTSSYSSGGGNIVDEVALTGGPSSDNSIVMENIGSPDLGSSTEPVLNFGEFAEFGPVTLKGASSIFSPTKYNPMSDLYAPTNMMFKNMQTLDRFTKARPEVPPIPGIGTVLDAMGIDVPNPLQALSDFGASVNRPFFEKVIRAGKIPGLNFATLSDMSDQDLENFYQDYMKQRGLGQIDAYGNKIIPTDDNDTNPLKNLLLAKEAAEEPEKLQGGVAQLYNQYLENLGSV